IKLKCHCRLLSVVNVLLETHYEFLIKIIYNKSVFCARVSFGRAGKKWMGSGGGNFLPASRPKSPPLCGGWRRVRPFQNS
ncbi:MAG: hypothetical protein AAB560_01200, partial [Patescibacteria group bacterium]